MSTLLGRWPVHSPEWHEARRTRIGGSEIGTVMGWNPYEAPSDLLARKLGHTEPRPDTAATIRGRYLETAVAEWLSDIEGVTYDPYYDGTFVHPEHDFALFNPDRVTLGYQLVEIKTAAEKTTEKGWGRAGTDAIPLTYQAQCQWGLGILGLDSCLIGVCFGSPFEFRRYRMNYDPRVFAALLAAGDRFITELQKESAA